MTTYIQLSKTHRLRVNQDHYTLEEWREARESKATPPKLIEAHWGTLSKHFPTVLQGCMYAIEEVVKEQPFVTLPLSEYVAKQQELWEEMKGYITIPSELKHSVIKPQKEELDIDWIVAG